MLQFYLRHKDGKDDGPYLLTVERVIEETLVDDEPTTLTVSNIGDRLPNFKRSLEKRFGEPVEMA
jgi:hypothetical protein